MVNVIVVCFVQADSGRADSASPPRTAESLTASADSSDIIQVRYGTLLICGHSFTHFVVHPIQKSNYASPGFIYVVI